MLAALLSIAVALTIWRASPYTRVIAAAAPLRGAAMWGDGYLGSLRRSDFIGDCCNGHCQACFTR
jgi:hypothetical protein